MKMAGLERNQKVKIGPFLILRSRKIGSIFENEFRSSHRFPISGKLRVLGGSLGCF